MILSKQTIMFDDNLKKATIIMKKATNAIQFPKASDFVKKVNKNKEIIVPVVKEVTVVEEATVVEEVTIIETATVLKIVTKADKARIIFAECYSSEVVPQRKDIINRLISEAGLTKAGGATYLQNYKSKHGLTNKK